MHDMWSPDEEPDGLPEGVTPEALDALVSRAFEAAKELGLYCEDGHYHLERVGDHLALRLDFVVGDRAFSAPVQDPEQAGFDDSFRKIEHQDTRSQYQEILDRHSGPKGEPNG